MFPNMPQFFKKALPFKLSELLSEKAFIKDTKE